MNIFLAIPNFEKELAHELKKFKAYENFYLSEHSDAVWCQDAWRDVQEIRFESISEAVQKLKRLHSHWVGFSVSQHRRCQLIQEQLNFYKKPKLEFLGSLPNQRFGCFLMIDKNLILASCNTKHILPGGEVHFKEDKETSPSRAYLKLWELFTVYGIRPKPDETTMDLGSCPGGWSWVLSQTSQNVVSVDKAPLAPKIAKLSNIRFMKKDAFELNPKDVGQVDWLFSDIICEPSRLYKLVEKWRDAGVERFVCTIKFKGQTDFDIIKKFKAIEGSELYHLYHNKHELTWVKRS